MGNVFKHLHSNLWQMKLGFIICTQSWNLWETVSKGPEFDFGFTLPFYLWNHLKERITAARVELFQGGKAANDSYKVAGLSDNSGNKSRVYAPFTCVGAQPLDNAAFLTPDK